MAKGALGFLQKIGLVEEVPDEEAKPNGKAAEAAPAPAHQPPPQAHANVPAAPDPEEAARNAALDKMVKKQLADAIEQAGAALVEELVDLMDTLRDSIPDEKLRYTTALKILMKKGSSVVAICTDIDKCIGALEAKEREFNATLKDQFDKRVGGRGDVVTSCDEQIAAKTAQITQLQNEIADLTVKKSEAQTGISEEKDKLEQAQERFTLAYHTFRTEIESQRAKITQYGESL